MGLDSLNELTNRVELTWDRWDFERQGWTSPDMKRFRCPSAGWYHVSATVTMRVPATLDGKAAASIDTLIYTAQADGAGATSVLKSLNNTKIIGSYLSVHAAGRVHLDDGAYLYATAAGWAGTWRKAASENKTWSMNALSAIQVTRDTKGPAT